MNCNVTKFEVPTVTTGTREWTHNGHTQMLPTTMGVINVRVTGKQTGKTHEGTDIHEFVWDATGDKILAFNHHVDTLAYTNILTK